MTEDEFEKVLAAEWAETKWCLIKWLAICAGAGAFAIYVVMS